MERGATARWAGVALRFPHRRARWPSIAQPTRLPQRVQIGRQMEVAVAQFPVGKFITGRRFHFHIGGEQVITGVRAGPRRLGQKEFGIKAFAQQTSIMVAEGNDDGVDIAGCQPWLRAHPRIKSRVLDSSLHPRLRKPKRPAALVLLSAQTSSSAKPSMPLR